MKSVFENAIHWKTDITSSIRTLIFYFIRVFAKQNTLRYSPFFFFVSIIEAYVYQKLCLPIVQANQSKNKDKNAKTWEELKVGIVVY